MTTFRERRRARRIASDEAHAWARSLHLGNPAAKSVLRAVALYVDGDGECYVSLEQLADDTDLSVDTVRRRMAWLEEIGAIARLPQWIDARGRRTGDDNGGKRTTDLIRLLFAADEEEIEARASGDETSAITRSISPSRQQGLNSDDAAISPRHQQGLNSDQPSPSPRLALAVQQGPDSLNLEPESPPKPPRGGESEGADALRESEPEDFTPAWSDYPGREVMSHIRHLALDEFRRLSKDDQGWCRRAVPMFARALAKAGRTKPPNFHLWIRARGFAEFPDAKVAIAPTVAAASQRRMIEGDELAAVQVALKTANLRELTTTAIGGADRTGRAAGYWSRLIGPDLLAMAYFRRDDRLTWDFVEQGSPSFAAWRDRLKHWIGVDAELDRKWLEDYNAAVHGLPGSDPNWKPRKSMRGLRVPRPFPPRVDGTWSDSGEAA